MSRADEKRLPPQCGVDLKKPFLYNPYQMALLQARRARICPTCLTMGPVGDDGTFRCLACGTVEASQLIARKAFRRVGIVGGRRSGKTSVGAFSAREEVVVPNGLGWVCGPTFKILHDSTMPAFFKILPPQWVKHWSAGDAELTLVNNHVVQFRSLDDPERGRGQGPSWSWFDEAQKMREKAWDVFRPSLTENLGNTIFTFTPNGFDWTWRRLWRPAAEEKYRMAGFWMAKCRTLDNPHIQKYGRDEVEEARITMPAGMFRQEYEADFVSFVGNVYDWETIEPLILQDDGLRYFIPEWPNINPNRECVLGFSNEPGAPAAAVLLVITERGVVVAREYLDEHRSTAFHFDNIRDKLLTVTQGNQTIGKLDARWTHDEEFTYVVREGSRKGVGVVGTEHYLIDGVQRVQTWMYGRQLWFAHTCEKTLDQMRGYRWSDNVNSDEKAETERVFRKDDELPNALRSALLSWPSLPEKEEAPSGRDLSKLDPSRAAEILRVAAFEKGGDRDDHDPDLDALTLKDDGYPFGGLFGNGYDSEP